MVILTKGIENKGQCDFFHFLSIFFLFGNGTDKRCTNLLIILSYYIIIEFIIKAEYLLLKSIIINYAQIL